MNRIYKVVWSKARQSYVVASEFAHSCTKSTTSRVGKSALAALAAFVLTAGVGGVQAESIDLIGAVNDDGVTTTTTLSTDNVKKVVDGQELNITVKGLSDSGIVGGKASATGIAIGQNSFATATNTTAMGVGSKAFGSASTAIGANAQVVAGSTGRYSVALGADSVADGQNMVSVGNDTLKRQIVNVAAGTEDTDAVNVGQLNERFGVYEDAGIVAGSVDGFFKRQMAIGKNAYSEADQGLAIGEDSHVTLGGSNSVALGYGSVADRVNTVSVGKAGAERQITNVAAGTEDTDAVNVGQLNERFSSYEDGGVVAGTVKEGVNNSIAVGEGSYVGSDQSTALGEYSMISDNATQSVALGTASLVYSANSVALGYGSVADRENTVSVGSAGNERQITNVAAGTERTDAVNVGQLQDALSGVGIDAEGGNVVQADKDGNVTIDGNLDVNGGLTVGNTVISGEDLAGVADISGIKTDVKTNASNITALQDKVGSGDITVKDASGNAVTNLTDAVNANYTQIQNNSNAINSLGNRVSDLGDEIDSVGAISAALAGLHPLDYDGTGSKFQISAAMGTYDGTQAAAIGGFYHFNRDVMLSLGGATSFEGDKKTAANIGVTFRVGEGASGKAVSDDVMARLEAMDQKIAALEQENKDLKNVLGAIDTSLSKEFPDVPANHWAYEAVSKLAGNDIVAGYPDGEFHGDRTMTRYEMAEIIYKAMSKGVQVDQKLVNEFKPEMEQVAANQNA